MNNVYMYELTEAKISLGLCLLFLLYKDLIYSKIAKLALE